MARMAQALIRNGAVGDHRLPDDAFLRTFSLPKFEERVDTLRARNPVPRESRISFNEELHEYTIDGSIKAPRSVTGLVHSYAGHFDPHHACECMRAGQGWSERQLEFTKDGQVMTNDEIVALWRRRGQVASARGTLVHFHAEMFLNGCVNEHPQSKEFQQLLEIIAWLRDDGWTPFRTELCLFSCQLTLAGQADALFRRGESRELALVDWKRSRSIQFSSPFRRLREPLEHLEECNGWPPDRKTPAEDNRLRSNRATTPGGARSRPGPCRNVQRAKPSASARNPGVVARFVRDPLRTARKALRVAAKRVSLDPRGRV